MDWQTLRAGMGLADRDYPERTQRLLALRRVLAGAQYDHLTYDFADEKTNGGEYVPIQSRRPSVRTNLCRTVVSDTVSLLFGANHFPTILADDETTRAALAFLVSEARLQSLFLRAATLGAVGSVLIRLRVLRRKPYYDVLGTEFLTPEWCDDAPDRLSRVTEKRKVDAAELARLGYEVDETKGLYWFQRQWTDQDETWFLPWPVSRQESAIKPQVDAMRSVRHGLGFVPLLWVQNLPDVDDGPDGASTFERAVSTVAELDYLLSQGGRGLKYSSDPTLVLKAGSDLDQKHVGGSAQALLVPPEGDAKLLEINGSAASAVLAHAQELRVQALEQMHGNRAHPDKMTAAQSGRAMELLNQGLVWLAAKLRISYGEGALLDLLRMTCVASQRVKGGLEIGGKPVVLNDTGINLKWPDWYPPTADDRMAEVNALSAALASGVLSRRSAVQTAMEFYDIPDLDAEMLRIEEDRAADAVRQVSLARVPAGSDDNVQTEEA